MTSRRTTPEHGDRARYRQGCTCPECKAANASYQQANRNRHKAAAAPSRWAQLHLPLR